MAHYYKGNKNFFSLIRENQSNIKKVKFNFSTDNKKIENFFKKKDILKSDIMINALGEIFETKWPYKRYVLG